VTSDRAFVREKYSQSRHDGIELPDGSKGIRDVVETSDAVGSPIPLTVIITLILSGNTVTHRAVKMLEAAGREKLDREWRRAAALRCP
jgi:hypothetical protein